MKTYILKQFLAIFVGIFCVVPYSFAELNLESVYPTVGKLGQPLNVILRGKGFDARTRVSFFPDSGNKKAVIGSIYTGFGSGSAIAITGTTAYMAATDKGLNIIDISIPSNPKLIGSADTPGYALDIAIAGTTAYIADGLNGLQIMDVSNSSAPRIIGSADTPGYAYSVVLVGTIAYVADGETGLQIIDISDPSMPKIMGSADTPGDGYHVTVKDNKAYIGDNNGLQITDVQLPSNPKNIGYVDMGASEVIVMGTNAYVATGGGLEIVDISNPRSAGLIGMVGTRGWTHSLSIAGDFAYAVVAS